MHHRDIMHASCMQRYMYASTARARRGRARRRAGHTLSDMLLLMLPVVLLPVGTIQAAPPSCTLLPGVGLHAEDDLSETNATSAAECCRFCHALAGCAAFTLNGEVCRAKGPLALNNATQVPCEGCISGLLPHRSPPPPSPRPLGLRNVLFIVVDDLRPQMQPYGQKQTLTPHLASFAADALVFDRAYCQQAVCSPSRNSFLSGRRPDTTKAWNFRTSFRDVGLNWTSMPQYFKNAGWFVGGTGKVYHPGLPPNDDPPSWSEPYDPKGQQNVGCPPCPEGARWCGNAWCSLNTSQNVANNDEWITADGKRLLSQAAAQPKPFFVAVGLHKPHTPYAYPSTIDALYPPAEQIALPSEVARHTPAGMPPVAWEHCSAIEPFNITSPMPDLPAKQHRRAYYAAVTHTDSMIGDLLSELQALRLANSTAVVVIGDHGYELGEHDMWCKKNNFELGVRVPFIARVPWIPQSLGQRTSHLAELVDLYPTLADLVELPPPPELGTIHNGVSLMAVFEEPLANHRESKPFAFSQYPRCGRGSLLEANGDCLQVPAANFTSMGYSVRDSAFRYTEWKAWDGMELRAHWSETIATELYDHRGDDGTDFDHWENRNIVNDATFHDVVARLQAALQAQFGPR